VGAALALVCALWRSPSSTAAVRWSHAALVVPFALSCIGWLPDSPTIRTATGQCFAVAVVYCLRLCPEARWGRRTTVKRRLLSYAGLTVGTVVLLQVAVRLPYAETPALLSGLALLGLLVLVGFTEATVVAVCVPRR